MEIRNEHKTTAFRLFQRLCQNEVSLKIAGLYWLVAYVEINPLVIKFDNTNIVRIPTSSPRTLMVVLRTQGNELTLRDQQIFDVLGHIILVEK